MPVWDIIPGAPNNETLNNEKHFIFLYLKKLSLAFSLM